MEERLRKSIKQITYISEDDWQLLLPKLRYHTLSKGGYFVKEGQVCRHLGYILTGSFRTYYINNGNEVNINFYFEDGWAKSFMSFLTQSPSSLYVQALEDAELFLLGYDDVQELYRMSKNWEQFGRIVTEVALIESTKRTESLLLETPEVRYQTLLKHYPHIFERVPLYHIASYLGVTQPSLSRIKSRIVKKK